MAVVDSLRNLQDVLLNSRRTITMVSTEIAKMEGFQGIQEADVRLAVTHLVGASQGSILLDNDDIILNVDYDELERAVQALTGEPSTPQAHGCLWRGIT